MMELKSSMLDTTNSKELRTPFKWSKELINELDKTRIQGPLGISFGIDVLTSIEGDLQLPRK